MLMHDKSSDLTLAAWLALLESLHPEEIELGLGRITKVADKLPLSSIANRVISVAGTNGKGSTICVLSHILEAAGLKVGCYTSPHLLRYNERIAVNHQELSDDLICAAFQRVNQARGDIPLTYFEFGTLAAFDLFARAELDVALLEVGLGGRLDATNIIDADMTVITSIALDHQDWLGDNREAIGYEKAGIMRAGAPVICGDPDPPYTLLHHAESLAAPLDCQGQQFGYEIADDGTGQPSMWNWWGHRRNQPVEFKDLPLPAVPLPNAATAIQTLVQMGLPIQEAHIKAGLEQSRLAGRFQIIVQPVRMVLDVAHNPQAAEYLAQRLTQEKVDGRIYALLGMLKDKDCEGIVRPLIPLVDYWATCDLNVNRAMRAEEIAAKLSDFGHQADSYSDVAAGIGALTAKMAEQDLLLIFGSFYTVGAALRTLNIQQGRD